MGDHPWDKNNSRSEQAFFLMSVFRGLKIFSIQLFTRKNSTEFNAVKNIVGRFNGIYDWHGPNIYKDTKP
jgi:hypothetical protein